jgi:1-acyl-sn-glycerol-3-phosphate acyltransferase
MSGPTSFHAIPESVPSVRALMTFNEGFCQIYHSVETIGRWQIPARGAAILVCNHISGLDPLLVQSVSPRAIVWMMAKEYYELSALNWVFRAVESIPVDRSGRDLSATRTAMRALAAGRILGIFPEGKIETARELLPFQTGVALMAIKTGVGVYPAHLEGSQRGREMLPAFVIPARARLTLGSEVKFDRSSTHRDALDQASKAIQRSVADLQARGDAASA